jgi:hypothetical protein
MYRTASDHHGGVLTLEASKLIVRLAHCAECLRYGYPTERLDDNFSQWIPNSTHECFSTSHVRQSTSPGKQQ